MTTAAEADRYRAAMKKTVVTFGMLSGAVATATMLAVIPFLRSGRESLADVLGYTSMVLAALLVFFGIRSHREHGAAGRIGFGRGLAVGLLITLLSCAVQAVAFEIVYFALVPDFGNMFTACMVERARASGATPQQIEETRQRAQVLKRLYDQPATNAALTFGTSFPIGLAATVVSAAILRRR
jgi:hypothetical protein